MTHLLTLDKLRKCVAASLHRICRPDNQSPLFHVGCNAVCSQTAYHHQTFSCSFSFHYLVSYICYILLYYISDISHIHLYANSYLSKFHLRSNSRCCPFVVRLLFDCCPINKRTTNVHQTHFNRTKVGIKPWENRR
jgi:hypothetical protein